MRNLLASLSVLLSGCGIVAPAPSPMGVYDLGPVAAEPPAASPVVDLHVTAAAELRTRDMLYRDGADSGRLQSYAEHRWAAPPALMLERHLLLLMSPRRPNEGAPARVDVQLLVFEQQFDGERGEAVLTALAVLARSSRECARTRFDIAVPMPSADARGGARAFSVAAGRLADDLNGWIGENAGCAANAAGHAEG